MTSHDVTNPGRVGRARLGLGCSVMSASTTGTDAATREVGFAASTCYPLQRLGFSPGDGLRPAPNKNPDRK
jgi:hypothetical protein